MSFLENFRMAWRSLLANKLRAALTMLGMVIGVAAVIALISLGEGATGYVTSEVSSLGTNLVSITPVRSNGVVLYYPQDLQWLLETVPQISQAAPLIYGSVTASYGNQTWSTTLMGTTPPSETIMAKKLAAGRYLTAADIRTAAPVAVLGQTVAQELFPTGNPLGATIEVNGYPLTVVGVLQASGGGFGPNQDDVVITPVTTAGAMLGTTQISSIEAEARTAALAPLAVAQVEAVMNHRFDSTDAATVVSENQLLGTLSSITGTLTTMLAGIAGISLLVGGIGIMNIMLVTVRERTREIGLRKALGAKRRAIVLQFLVEAGLLSLVGGAIGTAIGVAGASIVGRAIGFSGTVQPQAILLALLFSIAVGLIFGIWPAQSASRLDPINALHQL
jgi:putative ABC transport system permease protein